MAGVWGSIKAAAQQQQLQGHLREYLRHSGSYGGLRASAAHMRLLLGAAGLLGAGSGAVLPGRGGADASKGGSSAVGGGLVGSGLDLLGVEPGEARSMARGEWCELVAAAAASAALSVDLPASLAHAAAGAAADAALHAARDGGDSSVGGSSSRAAADGSECAAGAAGEGRYLPRLARALADAHRLLQHVAVAAYLLPSGPARRQLLALAAPIRQRLDSLEPLLLALPEREGLPLAPCAEDALLRASHLASAQPEQQVLQPQVQRRQRGSSPSGNGSSASPSGRRAGGFLSWVLEKLYGIEAPPAGTGVGGPLAADEAAHLARLDSDVLLQQVQFAAAVHLQRHAVSAALAALEADCHALRGATRAHG